MMRDTGRRSRAYTSTWNITGSKFSLSGGTVVGSGENAYTTAGGNSGINFEIRNAATVSNFTMTGNSLTGNFADGMQISPAASTTGSLTATIQNNSFSNNNIALDLNSAASADMTYKVLNNTFENTARNATGGIGGTSHMINLFMDTTSTSASLLQARFVGNSIGDAAIAGSGSSFGNALRVNFNGNGIGNVLIDSNTIREAPQGRGMEIIGRNGTGQLDVTVTNNNVNHINPGFNPGTSDFELAAILIQSNTVSITGYTIRSDVRGNTVPATLPDGELLASYIALLETGASNHQLVDNPSGPAGETPTQQLTSTNTGSASANAGVSLIAGPITTPP